MTGDELDEQALERALTAPGSPGELADEETFLAMYRAAGSATTSGAGRTVRRVGTSATLAVVFAVAGTGVAAAYSSSLPDPVQRVAHTVLAPLGVPAAGRRDHAHAPKDRQPPGALHKTTPS